MIVPIVYDVIFYLGRLNSDTHAFHGGDNPLVWNYSICSYDNSRSLVSLPSKIIPFTLLYLVYLVPSIRVYVEYTSQHLFRVGC